LICHCIITASVVVTTAVLAVTLTVPVTAIVLYKRGRMKIIANVVIVVVVVVVVAAVVDISGPMGTVAVMSLFGKNGRFGGDSTDESASSST